MTNQPPLVSAIIPTLNCADTIERCIASVRAQTYPHVEIIVVDNDSTDGTAQIAAEGLRTSQGAKVLRKGPERGAQLNYGAREARGEYLYRIDGDFVLDPGVISACVEALQHGELDAIAVPNRSVGDGYWARVRALERDTYLDDPLIVAARFFRRTAFEDVGGFDETLVACEDYDLHNRLLQKGYRVGRVAPVELHLGEANSLRAYAVQAFYYGPSVWRYLRKHPRRGMRQMSPLRGAYLRHWHTLARHPQLLLGLVTLKLVQYTAAAVGILAQGLGLPGKGDRPAPTQLAVLALVLTALWGLARSLVHIGLPMAPLPSLALVAGGVALWQVVGRRHARLRDASLEDVLPRVALAFIPLLALLVLGAPGDGDISRSTWPFLFALSLAVTAAWLTYFAEPTVAGRDRGIGPPSLVVAAAVGFVLLFSVRAVALLRTFSLDVYDLAVYDQALWTTVHGGTQAGSLSRLLFTSLYGRSIFAEQAAPILLGFLPAYAADAWLSTRLGGPLLLLVGQSLATALAATALYRLAVDQIGRLSAAFVAVGYLFYFLTLRSHGSGFHPAALAALLILFALEAYRRRRYALYYALLALAMACGIDAGLAIAGLGLYQFLFGSDRSHGTLTLGLSLGWTLVAIWAFIPFFGGTPAQVLEPYGPPGGGSALAHTLSQLLHPQALRYLAALLAPLSFVPLLGAPLLLPAVPRLLLNLVAQAPPYTALYGWHEFLVTPFLFLAAIRGLHWARETRRARGGSVPRLAGGVLIGIGCLVTGGLLAPFVIRDLAHLRTTPHQRLGHTILNQISADASVAVQSPFGVQLAHRRQLFILPQVEEADFILFDLFHPNRGPYPPSEPDLYQATMKRAFDNPAYGLRTGENGYLLFERGLGDQDDLARLALASRDEIPYTHTVDLTDAIRYRGFGLSATEVRPGELFYLTHYWESLAPLRKPYWLFTGYPGGHRFEQAVFGLYPVDKWQPGDIVRHEQVLSLPELPEGDDYEIVAGLWYDTSAPELRSAEQLLGQDVIRIATISVKGDRYRIIPWASSAALDHPMWRAAYP